MAHHNLLSVALVAWPLYPFLKQMPFIQAFSSLSGCCVFVSTHHKLWNLELDMVFQLYLMIRTFLNYSHVSHKLQLPVVL